MAHNGINYPRIIEAGCAGDKCWVASFPSRSRGLFFPCVVSWLTRVRAWVRRRAGHQWRRPRVTRGQCSVVTRQRPQHQARADNGAMVTRNIITLLLVRHNSCDFTDYIYRELNIKTRVNLMEKWSKNCEWRNKFDKLLNFGVEWGFLNNDEPIHSDINCHLSFIYIFWHYQ